MTTSSASPDSPASGPQAPRRRHPAERLFVWLLIVSLLVVTAIEVRAYYGYNESLKRLEQAARTHLDATPPAQLTIEQARRQIIGRPVLLEETVEADRISRYRWDGWFKHHGEIAITAVEDGRVHRLVTGFEMEPDSTLVEYNNRRWQTGRRGGAGGRGRGRRGGNIQAPPAQSPPAASLPPVAPAAENGQPPMVSPPEPLTEP